MAGKYSGFDALGKLAVSSAPKTSTQRGFAPTMGTAASGTLLNQNANSPRYGQRYRETVVDGRIVHAYADGTRIDMGPMKGRVRPTVSPAVTTTGVAASTTSRRTNMPRRSYGQ